MNSQKNVRARIFWLCIFAGVIVRFVLMRLGQNFDFESYCIVGRLASEGRNVYAETTRYNYGPVWFTLLGMFWRLSSFFLHNIAVFRVMIVGMLTLADFLIARTISHKAGNFWGLVFFLNPVSLIITGYHNQFDNIAVLAGIYAVLFLEKTSCEHDIKFGDICGIILLSLSLVIKHILWAFPLWILLSRKIDTRKKVFYAFIPPVIFLMSFAPYWSGGYSGIVRNVFLYKSFNNYPFFGLTMLNHFGLYLPLQQYICLPIFGLLMLGCAYLFRCENIADSFMLYTMALVAFSSAIANQYLAIPCMAVVLIMRRKSVAYFLLGLVFLSCNSNGLHIPLWLEKHCGIDCGFIGRLSGSGAMYSLFAWCLAVYLACYWRKNHRKLPYLRP